MKKRLILLILSVIACSIFSSIPKERIRCMNCGNMGIFKWLSITKKEKFEQTCGILALFLYHKRILVSNFVDGGAMPMKIRFTGLLLLMMLAPALVAQDSVEIQMVEYSPDFEFRDGIFANFEMVKDNKSIPPARIVTDLDMFDREFYDKVTASKEIVIYDENGVKKVMKTLEIWGYARNGVLYINLGANFHRISFVGSICHFVATRTSYDPAYYDPYYYNYSPYSYYSNPYSYNRYGSPGSRYTNTELNQHLFDFETGEVLDYNMESVDILLMKDPELADEYQALRNRKKKQMKFVFIRRYNEKHPLYFPAN